MSHKKPDPYLAGMTMLSRRELSSAQLRDRLQRKDFAPDDIETALRRLQDIGALDDLRTARALAHTAAHIKMRGRFRAIRELQERGIDRALSVRVVDEVYGDLDQHLLLERALARRLKGRIETRGELRRLYQYLIRQGFEAAAARSVLMTRAAPAATGGDD